MIERALLSTFVAMGLIYGINSLSEGINRQLASIPCAMKKTCTPENSDKISGNSKYIAVARRAD